MGDGDSGSNGCGVEAPLFSFSSFFFFLPPSFFLLFSPSSSRDGRETKDVTKYDGMCERGRFKSTTIWYDDTSCSSTASCFPSFFLW